MIKGFVKALTLAGVSAAALGCGISGVQAGAFGLREQGAQGQGMSFAGVAAGSGGLSSMYWNPATITMNPGWQQTVNVSLIDLSAKITPIAGPTTAFGPSGGLGELAAVPASATTYQVNDWLWVGMTTNAPLGLVTKPNYAWSGQVYGRTSKVFSVNFNPIIGIKVNEWLSVAAGPTIEYVDVKLRRAAPFSPLAPAGTAVLPNAPSATLRGDDVAFGYTIGATITPMEGTQIGVGYRSSIHHKLEGRITSPTLPFAGNRVLIQAPLNTPDLITVGLTQAITKDLRVNVGYEFSNWSRLGTIPQTAVAGPLSGAIVNTLPLNYKDGHFVSFGAEYDYSQQWTFRAGVAYEWSPVSDAVRSVAVPDANRVWASLGASYRISDKLTVDLAYSHVFAKKGPINIQPGDPDFVGVPYTAMAKGSVDIFSAAVRYRWDDPVVARAAPITRKY